MTTAMTAEPAPVRPIAATPGANPGEPDTDPVRVRLAPALRAAMLVILTSTEAALRPTPTPTAPPAIVPRGQT